MSWEWLEEVSSFSDTSFSRSGAAMDISVSSWVMSMRLLSPAGSGMVSSGRDTIW